MSKLKKVLNLVQRASYLYKKQLLYNLLNNYFKIKKFKFSDYVYLTAYIT